MLVEKQREKSFTINDVARLAGVSKGAVSSVINSKSRVGKATEEKIWDIIRKYRFVPHNSARALSTNRTQQIGFLVSDMVTLGLANSTFSTYMAGVGDSCQNRKYRMVVSAHDMTKVKNFIVIDNLRQRCVDGLVLTGLFDCDIVDSLHSLNIPMMFIGGTDQENIPVLRADMHQTRMNILEHLTSNGHRKIFFACSLEYIRQSFIKSVDEFNRSHNGSAVDLEYGTTDCLNEFVNGKKYAQQWMKQDKATRYTAFIANDQICCGFLSEITGNGIKCPDEISIFSNTDSIMCRENAIPISATHSLSFEQGKLAGDLLIDLIENKKTPEQVREILKCEYKPYELAIRATTGMAPKIT